LLWLVVDLLLLVRLVRLFLNWNIDRLWLELIGNLSLVLIGVIE
jgi:hypothetical protein